MRTLLALNSLYARYSEGLLDRKDFEGEMFKIILANIHDCYSRRWGGDDSGDFVSWVYPRLSKAIDSYRYTGASFASFIRAVICWSGKEYRSRKVDHDIAEYASLMARIPDLYLHENEPEYPEYEAEPEKPVPACQKSARQVPPAGSPAAVDLKKIPRQLLFLVLKCYYFVSDDLLDRIASRTGMEKEYLWAMIDKLRTLRLKRDEELSSMRERIYCQFYRCIMLERKIEAMPPDSGELPRLQARLQRTRRRLAAMRKRYAGIRPDPTNRQIAEVLGLSKGTIDSSLHVLKNRWNNAANTSILN
jgi:hypothetical protein